MQYSKQIVDELNENNIVKAVPIAEGMTIYFNSATSYFDEKNRLAEAGFEMISNDEEYGIYIISTPYECSNANGLIYRIK